MSAEGNIHAGEIAGTAGGWQLGEGEIVISHVGGPRQTKQPGDVERRESARKAIGGERSPIQSAKLREK